MPKQGIDPQISALIGTAESGSSPLFDAHKVTPCKRLKKGAPQGRDKNCISCGDYMTVFDALSSLIKKIFLKKSALFFCGINNS